MHDLVIRNGNIVDGSGQAMFVGDLAIDGQTITALEPAGQSAIGPGKQEIDATGLLVTPGFVDVHTHYDGQATWDSLLSPSIFHGVSTVVMGNCGVGFAPVKKADRDWLISLMEGVEDIPGSILSEGIDWQWETFPEFLDTLDSKQHSIDIAAQLPHGALRTYVMGERGGQHESTPTDDEVQTMAQITKEALEAGAIGFSTSRTVNHKSADGEHTPSLTAGASELLGIATGLKDAGQGVIQLISDLDDHDAEFDLITQMALQSGRPLSMTLNQIPEKADEWRHTLSKIEQANRDGATIRAQVAPRPVGLLLSLQGTYNPFILCPAYQEIAPLSLADKINRLNDKQFRQQLLDESQTHPLFDLGNVWEFANPPVYEPDPADSIAAQAEKAGIAGAALALDMMLSDDGCGMLYMPALNFSGQNSDVSGELLTHPLTLPGLGDGGAHVSFIMDASFTTYQLTHWCRDRKRGELIPIEYMIKAQCRDTAEAVGFLDRGLLQPGMKADINIIDFDALSLARPEMVQDLPAGGHRLIQKTDGYRKLIVSGQIVVEDGVPTGAKPGKLVRGAQQQPA